MLIDFFTLIINNFNYFKDLVVNKSLIEFY